MQSTEHDGRTIRYRETQPDAGGPTVLYVHGSGATHRVWAVQYGPDGPAYPAVALDLSGHGASDDVGTEPGPKTLSAYAQDVTAVARATDAEVLVGNSLGGAVVQQVVLETDLDPSGLVLAGSGAKLTVLEDLRERLTDDFDRAVDFLHDDDRLFHDADDRTVDRSRSEMRDAGRAVTRRDFLTCHAFDVRDRLDEIDVPALAVVGEYDGLTPPAYHEYLADRLSDCTYAEVEDAAHLAMVERPTAFNRAVARFLESVDG
ncbi:alpha/beta hydrolase [Halobacteriales archaeon QS_9_67_15]|nr:MAG: alpha/beta hydrolase [Halobacteriales archaeon QS_9_67_15]